MGRPPAYKAEDQKIHRHGHSTSGPERDGLLAMLSPAECFSYAAIGGRLTPGQRKAVAEMLGREKTGKYKTV